MSLLGARRFFTGISKPGIFLSGSNSLQAGSSQGWPIGNLTARNTKGTPTWSLTDNGGDRVQLVGSLQLQAGSVASYIADNPVSITVHVTGISPTLADKSFSITIYYTPSMDFSSSLNSMYLGQVV